MQNFLFNFQAMVQNKPGAKFFRVENSRYKISPPSPLQQCTGRHGDEVILIQEMW